MRKQWMVAGAFLLAASAQGLQAQNALQPVATGGAPVVLTLKRAVELSLQNSKDIKLAKIQMRIADETASVTNSEFRPNLYAGSGAGYTYGLPETPGGRPPSVFNLTYTQSILNGPLRGLAKEQQEQARAQRIQLEDTRNGVMVQVASAYLELVKVRHSLELLRKEKESAQKIVEVTQERQGEGFELPVEVTKAQLTRAQVTQRILQLEGRQDELEVYLRSELGLAAEQLLDVTAEDLPGAAEQEGANLIAMAAVNNPSIAFAESDVKAKEFRLVGERHGYWPTLDLVSVYSVLAKFNFNNYTNLVNNFRYNNLNAGVSVQVPLFSSKTRAKVALAEADLDAAKINLAGKRNQVSAEVRQKSRRVQQADAGKEVSRLELQLAQQNVAVLQAQFGEGKTNLRDVERARLDENEKWMMFLDAAFQRQQAQLELLRTAGQLDKVLE
ncbi:MAG TPA: TolC family protein [Candidatus Acidoferrum sp.]|jgi:outer membrane protein